MKTCDLRQRERKIMGLCLSGLCQIVNTCKCIRPKIWRLSSGYIFFQYISLSTKYFLTDVKYCFDFFFSQKNYSFLRKINRKKEKIQNEPNC